MKINNLNVHFGSIDYKTFVELNKYVSAKKQGSINNLKQQYGNEIVDESLCTQRILKKGENWKVSEFVERFYREPSDEEKKRGKRLAEILLECGLCKK